MSSGKQSPGLFPDPCKSLRMRIPRRSRSFSRASSQSSADSISVSRSAFTHLFKVGKLPPYHSQPGTASLRNSSVLPVRVLAPDWPRGACRGLLH